MIELLVYITIALMLFIPLVGTLRGQEDLGAIHTLVIFITILTLGVYGLVAKLV